MPEVSAPTVHLTPITKNITVRLREDKISLPDDLQQKVTDYWQQLIAEKPKLFNGEAFSVVNYHEDDSHISIEMAITDFAHNIYSESHDMGPYAYRVLHTAALVISSDNKLIFGSMNQSTSRAGVISCSGGGLDYGDVRPDSSIDLDYSTKHELLEELGIDIDDRSVKRCYPAYFKTGGRLNKMTLLYKVELALTADEFKTRYDEFAQKLVESGEEPEYDTIFYLDNTPEAVTAFIDKHQAQLDVYMPALLQTVCVHSESA